ncbi:MAG: 30S ribosomal protein S15 [Methanobacteriota archaeon]|nr:MAG: 30S ribosomal protein S15 [Euryarchaeota archaeon]|tara:strand:- start:6955 stop:7410 length:456 start_codon:yes stop_codon:yes gene_type:complete
MARIHNGKKGKSGSTKPHNADIPEWSLKDPEKVKTLILELSEKGYSTAVIGTILRDQHAVPDVRKVCGKRINQILQENNKAAEIPEDLMNLLQRALALVDHLESNRKDLHNSRQLQLTESKIRRIARYYISEGKLSSDWKYDRKQVRLMVA